MCLIMLWNMPKVILRNIFNNTKITYHSKFQMKFKRSMGYRSAYYNALL